MAPNFELKCLMCENVFPTLADLQNHILTHEKMFIENDLVTSQKRWVTGKRRTGLFTCDLCQQLYRIRKKLERHLIRHKRGRGTLWFDENMSDYRKYRELRGRMQRYCNSLKNVSVQNMIQSCQQEYVCDLCQFKFYSLKILERHIFLHISSSRHRIYIKELKHKISNEKISNFYCQTCDKGFFDLSSLNQHNALKHKPRVVCDICGLKFYNNNKNLAHHLIQHIDGSADSRCLVEVKDIDILASGQRPSYSLSLNKNKGRNFKCEDCQASFKVFGQLVNHVLLHADVLRYTCHMCCATRTTRHDFVQHLECHYTFLKKDFRHKCDICPCTFFESRDLVQHKELHDSNKFLFCSKCEISFHTITEMINHMKIHVLENISPDTYSCDICSKSYRDIISFLNHYMVHVGGQDNTCTLCGEFVTSRKGGLSLHYERHGNVALQVLCDICGKSFKDKGLLTSHIAKHMIKKSTIVCPVCNITLLKVSYNTHKLIHSNERPHLCNECGKTFRMQHHLREHSRVHSGERPYKCPVCKASFKVLSHLKQHTGTDICRENAAKLTKAT